MLGSRSVEILKSATVSCKKILTAGFIYSYPTIQEAILKIETK